MPQLVANFLLEPGVAEAIHGGYPHWEAPIAAASIDPQRFYDPLQMGVDAPTATFLRLDPPWRKSAIATQEPSGEMVTVARLLDLLNRAMHRELVASTTNAHAREIPPRGASGARVRHCGKHRSLFREIKSFIIQIL